MMHVSIAGSRDGSTVAVLFLQIALIIVIIISKQFFAILVQIVAIKVILYNL